MPNPKLTNLKAAKTEKVSFSTTSKRFDNGKHDENDEFLGPGYYEHRSFVDSQKLVKQQNQKFLSMVRLLDKNY
jgi:hypothetical protein